MSNTEQNLTIHSLKSMLEYSLKNTYRAKADDDEGERILENCIMLFGKDYKYSLLDNFNGELCGHYPTRLVVLEYSRNSGDPQDNVESLYETNKLRTLVKNARFARCRGRFVAPVIQYNGKHICRAATLSGGAEIYGRQVYGMFVSSGEELPGSSPPNTTSDSGDWPMFSRVRSQDIKLLKLFNVGYIFDLMVEKKKVKFGMNVTSSEKVDKENRYCDFSISSIPYPGCEFFREWKDAEYRTEGMVYDWNQAFVDAHLEIPTNPSPPSRIDWTGYMNWDVVRLTQNYLLLLLHYIKEADTGLLVHCISGWDRTPLFISLIRLSLWAEGLIHPTLSPLEILYLTIAYDWFLFGHNFPDRLSKGEDIFFFCFVFLRYITGDEFNIGQRTKRRLANEGIVENAILDFDGHVVGRVGDGVAGGRTASNSSLSSINSTRSMESFTFCLSVGSCEEDSFVNSLPLNMATKSSSAGRSQVHAEGSSLLHSHSSGSTCLGSNPSSTSSPMAVPKSVQQLSSDSRCISGSYGSWQIITGIEGLKGSRTSSPVFHSSTPDYANHRSRFGTSTSETVENQSGGQENSRMRNLEEVHRLFKNVYASVTNGTSSLGSSGGGTGGGGLSSLLENFAEKVGFRSARSTFV